MAKGNSKGGENQRDRSAPKKNTAADQTREGDDDVPSQPPSRVHIFTRKPPRTGSSATDDKPLQCSLFETKGLFAPSNCQAQTIIFPGVPSPAVVVIKDELERLIRQIDSGRKSLYDAAMKAEDLEAIMQGLRRTRDRVFKNRR